MRTVLALFFGFFLALPAFALDERTLDKQLELILRDVHDRGANLHNAGDAGGCYRMYQGGLLVARQMIPHRPDLQKTITAGLQAAEKEANFSRRAVALHELIEKVRGELGKPIKAPSPEKLTIPPREVKPGEANPEPKPVAPKPTAKVGEIRDGIVGRVIWQGQPLAGVEISFLSLGLPAPRIYDTVSETQGIYSHPGIPPGNYLVILNPGPKCAVKTIPERYATSNSTPIRVEIKARGEKFDFLLQ